MNIGRCFFSSLSLSRMIVSSNNKQSLYISVYLSIRVCKSASTTVVGMSTATRLASRSSLTDCLYIYSRPLFRVSSSTVLRSSWSRVLTFRQLFLGLYLLESCFACTVVVIQFFYRTVLSLRVHGFLYALRSVDSFLKMNAACNWTGRAGQFHALPYIAILLESSSSVIDARYLETMGTYNCSSLSSVICQVHRSPWS